MGIRVRENYTPRLRIMQRQAAGVTGALLEDDAKEILNLSNQLAPQLTGALIDSGEIVKQGTGDTRLFGIGYGGRGPSRDYVVKQHEDTSLAPGPITALKPQAGPKFLSRAFNALSGRTLLSLQRELNRWLRDTARGGTRGRAR